MQLTLHFGSTAGPSKLYMPLHLDQLQVLGSLRGQAQVEIIKRRKRKKIKIDMEHSTLPSYLAPPAIRHLLIDVPETAVTVHP